MGIEGIVPALSRGHGLIPFIPTNIDPLGVMWIEGQLIRTEGSPVFFHLIF